MEMADTDFKDCGLLPSRHEMVITLRRECGKGQLWSKAFIKRQFLISNLQIKDIWKIIVNSKIFRTIANESLLRLKRF